MRAVDIAEDCSRNRAQGIRCSEKYTRLLAAERAEDCRARFFIIGFYFRSQLVLYYYTIIQDFTLDGLLGKPSSQVSSRLSPPVLVFILIAQRV